MASILFHQVDFHYASPRSDVFSGLSLLIDSGWRAGLVGRNGRGKSTLLRLIHGQLIATAGTIDVPLTTRLFTGVSTARGSTREVVRHAVAPFARWEAQMQGLLDAGNSASLERYADLHDRYQGAGGYQIDAWIEREFAALDLPASLLERPFDRLSGGEQTRALIASLFLGPNGYPLIDEPTNHLDLAGRQRLTDYLAAKPGFLLVSHDRHLLDGTVDHIVSLNRSDVRVNRGNYSQWKANLEQELHAERRRRDHIERDLARLKRTADARRRHAHSKEAEKYGGGVFDKGFIGRRAAKQMKRALHVERRMDAQIAEKRALLGNQYKDRTLKVATSNARSARMLTVQNLTLQQGGATVLSDLSFTLDRGDRLAIVGPNGCGKSTLLDAISGVHAPAQGIIDRAPQLAVSRSYQHPLWQQGELRARLARAGLDESRFRQVMGVLGIGAEVFERDLATFSQGQRKKVDLARSLLEAATRPADLLVWDEPLNYVDLYSREQIEAALLTDTPTLIFVEHDRTFIEHVATDRVMLAHR